MPFSLDPEVALAELRRLLHRCVAHHVQRAEQALALADAIGVNAWRINREGFGHLFHTLQVSLADEMVLSLTKMLETPDHKHKRRSIPVFLHWLHGHASVLRIQKRPVLETALAQLDAKATGTTSDPELIRDFARAYRRTLPTPKPVWIRRDKVIAHAEDLTIPPELRVRWDHARDLIKFGQDFASLIGDAFGVFYFRAQDGTYMLSNGAKEAAELMTKLLTKADLIDSNRAQRTRIEYRGITIEAEPDDVIWVAQTTDAAELLTGVGNSLDEALEDAKVEVDAFLGRHSNS